MFASAILYFLYHIFDVLDGKHSRNTGTSSPLGLLMDHGCDALTTFLFTMSLGSILKLEGTFWFALIWLMTSINFFFTTWEELHTDVLYFPIIHGVSEGTIVACGAMLFTMVTGQEFWLNTVDLFGTIFKYSEVLVLIFFILSSGFSIVSIIKAVKHENTTNVFLCLSNAVVFVFMVLTMFILIFYSNSIIVEKYPKLVIYMYGFCFAKLVVYNYFSYI
jgi:ethanolaminephosphotransferase